MIIHIFINKFLIKKFLGKFYDIQQPCSSTIVVSGGAQQQISSSTNNNFTQLLNTSLSQSVVEDTTTTMTTTTSDNLIIKKKSEKVSNAQSSYCEHIDIEKGQVKFLLISFKRNLYIL